MRVRDFVRMAAAFAAAMVMGMGTVWALTELLYQAVDAELAARSVATVEAKALAAEVRP